jgi:hypothetical protein
MNLALWFRQSSVNVFWNPICSTNCRFVTSIMCKEVWRENPACKGLVWPTRDGKPDQNTCGLPEFLSAS